MSSSVPYALSITHGPPLHPPADDIPGLPTLDDIRAFDVLFDWPTLKGFIREGELGKLRRHPDLQSRYDIWTAEVRETLGQGSTERYILNKRLAFPPPPENAPPPQAHFDSHTPEWQYCIAANDWPYSMPHDVYHFLIWTQLPLIPSDQLTPSINNIGVYGFSGGPSSPSDPPPGQPGDVQYELAKFVKNRWKEEEWETTWFMNPPRLQSVKLLPHYHVFARLKSPGEQ